MFLMTAAYPRRAVETPEPLQPSTGWTGQQRGEAMLDTVTNVG